MNPIIGSLVEREVGCVPDEEKGNWMELRDGSRFFPEHPHCPDIDLIADVLSTEYRYNSHTKEGCRLSVAEHSTVMAEWFLYCYPDEPALAHQALLHDAPEALGMRDIPRPVKDRLGPEYRRLEAKILACVLAEFGLPTELDPRIKAADSRILRDERMQAMNPSANRWATDGLEPLNVRFRFLHPEASAGRFRSMHKALLDLRK